jgi:hypothetical protein
MNIPDKGKHTQMSGDALDFRLLVLLKVEVHPELLQILPAVLINTTYECAPGKRARMDIYSPHFVGHEGGGDDVNGEEGKDYDERVRAGGVEFLVAEEPQRPERHVRCRAGWRAM